MLDDDPSNDATGDPIAGPDGIFARNQFVFCDDEMDFEVVAGSASRDDYAYVAVAARRRRASRASRRAHVLLELRPERELHEPPVCYLDVDNVLVDPDDAHSPTGGR